MPRLRFLAAPSAIPPETCWSACTARPPRPQYCGTPVQWQTTSGERIVSDGQYIPCDARQSQRNGFPALPGNVSRPPSQWRSPTSPNGSPNLGCEIFRHEQTWLEPGSGCHANATSEYQNTPCSVPDGPGSYRRLGHG